MGKLCPKGKAAAKRKFKVYPSAYANMYASAVCSGKVTPGGKKGRTKKADGGKVKKKKPIRKISFKAMVEAAKEKNRNPMKDQRLDDSIKGKTVRFIEKEKKAKGGKVGGLKKVQPHQKGLKKLPTKVRNNMGYMKKGGRVGMGKALRGGGCVR